MRVVYALLLGFLIFSLFKNDVPLGLAIKSPLAVHAFKSPVCIRSYAADSTFRGCSTERKKGSSVRLEGSKRILVRAVLDALFLHLQIALAHLESILVYSFG